jgi:hypothetical protein
MNSVKQLKMVYDVKYHNAIEEKRTTNLGEM